MSTDIRYSRQIALPSIGASGQAKLRDASVLVIGAGGLGAPASMYLASSGIGQLLINDFDRIDLSNLPRQVLYRSSDKGAYKARIAAERLQAINPATDVIALEERLQPVALEECIASVDAVLDCTDNFASRWLIN
jgi:molybdopterin/thiamine biosynthesis adenylyltransferase